ncbi:kynurenine aminotransferase isoform X3 [Plutella xylostella]|nr:kynurenine aminotransferase isoform X3 [Plutella xylostella]
MFSYRNLRPAFQKSKFLLSHQGKQPVANMTESSNKFKLPARYGAGEKSVWVEYIQLNAEYKPQVNLGQGFPDFHAPDHVRKALADVTTGPDPLLNQYTRGFGHPSLVKNLSRLYSPLFGREIDPMNEVLVTCGAYEALYSAILGHVDCGDEVVVIEPFFDCYDFMIRMAGGVPRFIALKPRPNAGQNMSSADWVIDEAELASLFNSKTKMIILNTPHNPLGKVFTEAELTLIADLCKKHNVLCLSDEVYEWMVYAPHKHIRIATLPDMWQRTITVGSAGKSFSVTGWKLGWALAPAPLMRNLQVVHQNCVYTCCTPVQEAVARAIDFELSRWGSPDCYYVSLARELEAKRDQLLKTLRDNGFKPTTPDGCYFIVADWTDLENKIDLSTEPDQYKDYKFTKKFAKEASVLAIPPTAFYSPEHKHLGENYARFCFIKKDENLALTDKLLREWNAGKK